MGRPPAVLWYTMELNPAQKQQHTVTMSERIHNNNNDVLYCEEGLKSMAIGFNNCKRTHSSHSSYLLKLGIHQTACLLLCLEQPWMSVY
jgi:hypothetical protein